ALAVHLVEPALQRGALGRARRVGEHRLVDRRRNVDHSVEHANLGPLYSTATSPRRRMEATLSRGTTRWRCLPQTPQRAARRTQASLLAFWSKPASPPSAASALCTSTSSSTTPAAVT